MPAIVTAANMKAAGRYLKPSLILAAICLFQWAILFQDINPTWDATFYYSYARSLLFDGDLQIANDLVLSYPTASEDFVERGMEQDLTSTGRVNSPFAVGSGLVWLPWLIILRIVYFFGQSFGPGINGLTGYEWFFTISIGLFSAALAWISFWIGYRISRKETDRFSALAAAITMLFATPLLYYQYREPLYSHATSAFVTALVVYTWWRSYWLSPKYGQAILLGALIGLATLVRWQHLIYFALPIVSTAWWWLTLSREEKRQEWIRGLAYLALGGLLTVAVFSIQLVHWKITFGIWITVPQGSSFINWQAPYLLSVLFSSFRGLLPWMPGALLGALGLVLLGRKNLRLVIPLLVVLALDLYINSSVRDWFAGGGYGPRRFTSDLVILIIGYSALIKAIPSPARKSSAILLGTLIFLHQLLLMRFGLADKIGGRVASMNPTFHWAEESYSAFFGRLLDHIPSIFRDPIDFFVHINSPVSQLISGQFPSRHLSAFFVTALFMSTVWLAIRFVINKRRNYPIPVKTVTLFALLTILAIDLYIFFLG